jgi:phage tail sheath protein FI
LFVICSIFSSRAEGGLGLMDVNKKKPDQKEIASEILAYLAEHSDASDTLEGILQWWLFERKIKSSKEIVNAALAELLQRGLVAEKTGPEGPRYRANLLSDTQLTMLHGIISQMCGKGQLPKPIRSPQKRGVPVLFAGPGKTGKTLAATILAEEMGREVHRIDLSAVISKYVGETEKNLRRIFDAAEEGGDILLFDEADALFGKRTEVKDSHDRYANVEVNYLLEMMETYNGLAILSTNLSAPIDEAFTRRLRFVVYFPFPEPGDRKRIWQNAFPAQPPAPPDAAATGPQHLAPGVYIEGMRDLGNRRIIGVETGIAGFLGTAQRGPLGTAQNVLSWEDFKGTYGTASPGGSFLSDAVQGFFENGGKKCIVLRVDDTGTDDAFISGLNLLRTVELNILCAPGIVSDRVQQALLDHCDHAQDRICILDPPKGASLPEVLSKRSRLSCPRGFGALYYPGLMAQGKSIPPSGHIAGVYARTDAERGVHKAPAGPQAVLSGVTGVERPITNADQDTLNPLGVNCIRTFPGSGVVVWGSRTLSDDPEWKYVNIRRMIIYLERSIIRGLQWAVFEPNTGVTWMNVRRSMENFLMEYWRSGALVGTKPEKAFFVKCDNENMTFDDIEAGRMNCLFGVAVLKPAEFIVTRIQLRSSPA